MDLDNTLVAWGSSEMSHEMLDWIAQAKEQDLKLCVVSNALKDRIRRVAGELGIPAVSKGKKPSKKPFQRALQLLGVEPEAVAVVGDQIFTDVLGGNRLRLYTILINPISDKELKTTNALRRVERSVVKRLHKKGLITTAARRSRLGEEG